MSGILGAFNDIQKHLKLYTITFYYFLYLLTMEYMNFDKLKTNKQDC